jgi:hypothetical protein
VAAPLLLLDLEVVAEPLLLLLLRRQLDLADVDLGVLVLLGEPSGVGRRVACRCYPAADAARLAGVEIGAMSAAKTAIITSSAV